MRLLLYLMELNVSILPTKHVDDLYLAITCLKQSVSDPLCVFYYVIVDPKSIRGL